MVQVEVLAEQAQSCARRLGIPQFDLYGAQVDETSVQVDHGEPRQVKASHRCSVTVRAWNDQGQVGVTSTTDVDEAGLELALQTAFEASHFGVREHAPQFSPEATLPIAQPCNDKGPLALAGDLLEQLVAAEKTLLGSHPAIQGVPYNGLAQRQINRFYLNSHQALRQEEHTLASVFLYSKAEQEGRKPRSAGAMRVARSLDELDIQGCVQEAAEKLISHLEYERIPSGKYTVVFSGEAFLSLLGAFSNVFNAQNILDNQSLSTPESLGKTIASPLLSVCDDALHPTNVGAISFDGEGTPTRRVPLITNGVLTHFLHSAGTAKRLGAQPTGHANIGAKVTVAAHYYHVFAGAPPESTYDLATAENVVWIDELQALHAGVKPLQGSFSLPFQGWWVRQGERISIEAATVAGDFLELLKSIFYVEPEPQVTPGGLCPRIWVADLSITGQ
jgi:PmbA protein